MAYTAGQLIKFTATFTLDAVPRLPASVTLRVRSQKSGVVAIDNYVMPLSVDRYTYTLDTSGFDATNHQWTIYTDDLNRAVRGGEFAIVRNLSNPF